MAIPAALEKRVGPFPLWEWGALAGAGVGIGLILRRRNKAKANNGNTIELSSSSAPSAGMSPVTGTGVPSGNAPAGGAANGSTGDSSAPAPTNLEWSKKAISWLIANGVDPSTADRAVRLYLEGQTLAYDENAAISLVLRSPIGVPPEYVPPQPKPGQAPVAPASPPTPGTNAPAGKKMLVRADDGDIAQFVSDGRTKEWVPDGYTAKAFVQSGNVAANGWDAAGWAIPYSIPRATLNGLQPIGPPPNYGGAPAGPRTTW